MSSQTIFARIGKKLILLMLASFFPVYGGVENKQLVHQPGHDCTPGFTAEPTMAYASETIFP
jgi:hypothetical protein